MCYDFGIKQNIMRRLKSFGCRLTVVPANTPAEDVLAMVRVGGLPNPGTPLDSLCGAQSSSLTTTYVHQSTRLWRPEYARLFTHTSRGKTDTRSFPNRRTRTAFCFQTARVTLPRCRTRCKTPRRFWARFPCSASAWATKCSGRRSEARRSR